MKFLKILFFLICVLAVFKVHAQSSSELKHQRDILTQQLDQLNHEYEETANSKKANLKQLTILKQKIDLREQEIKSLRVIISYITYKIS